MKTLIRELKEITKQSKHKTAIIKQYSEYTTDGIMSKIGNLALLLIAYGDLDLNIYRKMLSAYRRRNINEDAFLITSNVTFGVDYIENLLHKINPKILKASLECDVNFKGSYNFWYRGIRIGAGASRALENKKGTMISKALNSESKKYFDMNFQHLHVDYVDVYVWVAVWLDTIRIFVLSSNEVRAHNRFCFVQDRDSKGLYGQLHINKGNIVEFECFEVDSNNLTTAIVNAFKRQRFIQHTLERKRSVV